MSYSHHLSHLKDSLPDDVFTYQTSPYTVALEGWRRGLKLRFYNNKRGGRVPSVAITYSLSDGEKEIHFVCARGSNSTQEAISKAENKSSAYEYLKESGVPIPKSKTFKFNDSSMKEICEYGESIGYPLVVKPTNMGGGKGVFTHINSRELLKESLMKIRDDYKKKRVILEKYFEGGVDYRFFVIEDQVVAVTKSYSSNVIGDGENNLRQLIKIRNKEIKNNVATKNRTIKIDDEMLSYLSKMRISLDYVPKKGERVFVRKHGTHLGKRLNVDCTETVDPKFKEYAIRALNSIPGLPSGSIDMIINEEKNEGIVNEINTKGEIMMHVFPVEGKAIDVPKYLIDHYFPNSGNRNENFHFEYKQVKELFLTGIADEIEIPMVPKGPQYEKKFIITGKKFRAPYKKFKRKAANLYLIGYLKPLSKNMLEIKTIGSRESITKFEGFIETLTTEINSSEVKEFKGKSNISFEVIDEIN